MPEKKVPTATHTNLFVLTKCVESAPDGGIEKVAPADAPHLRRCIDAGLLVPAGKCGSWKLSVAGTAALKARSLATRRSDASETATVRGD